MFRQHFGGADWTWHLIATAIWADIVELRFCTLGAKGALIGADAGVGCIGREIGIAAFAIGFQKKHGLSFRHVGAGVTHLELA